MQVLVLRHEGSEFSVEVQHRLCVEAVKKPELRLPFSLVKRTENQYSGICRMAWYSITVFSLNFRPAATAAEKTLLYVFTMFSQ